MPLSRLLLILAVVIGLAGATVLAFSTLPPTVLPWLIPVLMAGALALRLASRR